MNNKRTPENIKPDENAGLNDRESDLIQNEYGVASKEALLRRASDINLPSQILAKPMPFLNASPSPYENEGFEDDDDAGAHDDDAGSDFDPLREDVSSEGSCRTSIYNRSQAGDNEDSAANRSSEVSSA